LDLQMDRLEYQLWVQKNWPTTLSASILSIKVHTILLCLDCWFWWSILTIPRLKWVSRSDIICRFFLMSEIFQKSNCIRVKSGELEAYPHLWVLGDSRIHCLVEEMMISYAQRLPGDVAGVPWKDGARKDIFEEDLTACHFFGEWKVVCFFKSFTQFLRQFFFGWSSSRVHPTTTGAPDGLVESSLWGCGGVMSCGWLDVSRAAQWCDDELSFFMCPMTNGLDKHEPTLV
jgi:hypothetical protein